MAAMSSLDSDTEERRGNALHFLLRNLETNVNFLICIGIRQDGRLICQPRGKEATTPQHSVAVSEKVACGQDGLISETERGAA